MSDITWNENATISTPEEMHELGFRLGQQLNAGDLVVLTGELGAGKTTLTRGIGEGMGIRGSVTSPTFVLARTHPPVTGTVPLVHVDAYRLGSADELDDLDLDFDGSAVVIEWGKGMVDESEERLEIEIVRPTGAGATDSLVEPRTIHFTGYGSRWAKGNFDAIPE